MTLKAAVARTAIAGLLLWVVACVTTRDRLTSAADRLEHHATIMAENARYQPPGIPYPPNYGQDALILANDASRLSDAAHEHGSEQEVGQAFAPRRA